MTKVTLGYAGDSFGDDDKLYFGNSDDYSIRYDSGADTLAVADEDGPTDKLDIDDDVTVSSGQLIIQDGSQSAPALSFSADKDTGIRRRSAIGSIALVNNGSDELVVNSGSMGAKSKLSLQGTPSAEMNNEVHHKHISTPSVDAAPGYTKTYFKSDNNLYKLDKNGNESRVGFQSPLEVFEGRESGTVADTNQGTLVIDHLADGESVEVYKAALTNADGSAVASGADLILATLDNAGGYTSQITLISGDGSTVYDDETASPIASYTNSSGGGQTIAVLVDNATGSSIDIMASAEGVTGK
jgi:hypothetical protein